MENEIINRVARSKLITFDLEELYPTGERVVFDLSQWLAEGLLLREKDFREQVKNHDWGRYKNAYVALTCTTDAIVPAWAFMLVASQLQPYAKKTVLGNLEQLETLLYAEALSSLDTEKYKDLPVIIKGCSKKPVPVAAYLMAVEKLQPVAKSILYGEACSSVPVYKSK